MRGRAATVLVHLARLGIALLSLLPLYWAVVVSLRQSGLPPTSTLEWWPQAFHWDTYAEVFRTVPMARYARNSLFVVSLALPLTLLTASLAGFALTQLTTAWRQRLVTASVALLLVPGMAVWTFRFHILNLLGLVDTLWALIVPALAGGSPLFVLLFYWAYWRVPRELVRIGPAGRGRGLDGVAAGRLTAGAADDDGGRAAGVCALLGRLYDVGVVYLQH